MRYFPIDDSLQPVADALYLGGVWGGVVARMLYCRIPLTVIRERLLSPEERLASESPFFSPLSVLSAHPDSGASSAEACVIIGAGPAGLTAAYELSRSGFASTVLESSAVPGGLARTEHYKGYRFDIGGHRFFTKLKIVDEIWHELLGNDSFHGRDPPEFSRTDISILAYQADQLGRGRHSRLG